MSESNTRQFVAFSTANRSGLMFYVSCDATSGQDYRVFVGTPTFDRFADTALGRCELLEQPRTCRCPDPAHNNEYRIIFNREEIILNTLEACTQLDPEHYTIDEMEYGVIVKQK